ncbi:MAG: bifunctional 3-(3-hydroxy-phenyl)propionate/3-hydroxycinnamic acid hydroxylase [Acidimicrobiales bacterium]|nr:bifunctional 3-(3-hydroxy-phenyl)propionate/3-hydroxycinnamic acid hydroxylase [Acidimicrobiales bacterium]
MPQVAVIGCGPVGALLANLLGTAGVETSVHEASLEAYPLPRACHLDAEIMRIFQGVGLSDQVGRLVEPSQGMEFVDADGTRLFTYEDFERSPILGWHEDYVFQQPQLDRVLREGLERFPGVELTLGSEVTDLDSIDAQFVVACDGASSATRRSLAIGLSDWGFDQYWLVVDLMFENDPQLPSVIQQVCDPKRPATYVPSAHGHHRWEFRLLEGENFEEFEEHQRVRELLRPWIPDDAGKIVRAAPYRFHAVVAERWRDGRFFLAGDAAHQMPPFIGQGMCSGIRDAANLAWKLQSVLKYGAPETLLDTYELERRSHVERCIAMSIEAGLVVSGQVTDFPIPDVNESERWSRLPPLTDGVFSLGDDSRIGHQARQPRVLFNGTELLLDDVGGSDWYLVSRVPYQTGNWCQTVLVEDLTDLDGGLALLLAGRAAVLIRPDRYVFGSANEESIDELVKTAERLVWGGVP